MTHFLGKIRISAMLQKNNGDILVTRDPNETIFEIPGGRMDENENIEIGILRELNEELGLNLEKINPIYLHSEQTIHGRENSLQLVVFFTVKVEDAQVQNLNFSNEVEEYKWVNKENYNELNYFNDAKNALDKYFNNY